MNQIRVAIDGPAGAGKSTVAKMVAKRLGLLYIDTGAMYRAVTWKAISSGVPLSDEERVAELAAGLDITFGTKEEGQTVWVDGVDVTHQIRSPEVTERAPIVAAIPGVREQLVKLQRKLADQQGVVMDGRDIGTCVLPDAEVKIFLTASLAERARRRLRELQAKGISTDLETVQESLAKRDQLDSTRELAPLRVAEDAYPLDTTGLTVLEVVDRIVSICQRRAGTNR